MFRFDDWGIRVIQRIWMGIIRDNRSMDKLNQSESNLLLNLIRRQIVYFYLKVVEHFKGNYSKMIVHTNRTTELDAQFALQAYHTYVKFFLKERTERQRNMYNQNRIDFLLWPCYMEPLWLALVSIEKC
jgi:hypothetical protein